MINVLILAAGQSVFHENGESYPLVISEIGGHPLLELLFNSCRSITDSSYTVALREADIRRFHLDSVVSMIQPDANFIGIPDGTKGAACSALLAAKYIDNKNELLIINSNEILEQDFQIVLQQFRRCNLDAGVVTFPSVHPRYSYVTIDDSTKLVTEAAEKKPISRMATAGFYWFKHGSDFVGAVQSMIRKDACVNDQFYICPSLNQLVLDHKKIGVFPISAEQYFPLKTEQQLNSFNKSHIQKVSQ
jgi:dTDP-glucose pyrophosphorylase